MADVVTSVSLDYTTTVETGTETQTGNVSQGNAVIVRVIILLVLAVFNLCGNGFTLITIRLTPRLWTKTNFILASMLVADVMSGVVMFWYAPFILVVYVFNNPCSYNVVLIAISPLIYMSGLVSYYHLILISVERYIAIVYPLQYETKFTDRTLKCAISTVWVIGIFMSTGRLFYLINADVSKCNLVPVQYNLLGFVTAYIPACIAMFICYGKILVIAWRQRKRIEPMNVNLVPAFESMRQAIATNTLPPPESSNAEHTKYAKHNEQDGSRTPELPELNRGTVSAETAHQRQQIKSRRREFKAVYLTAAIVGSFVILWFPNMLARVLSSLGYNPGVVNYLFLVGGAIGTFNFSFAWAIYAAVSKNYRRAYRQVLIRIGCCCCKNVTLQADNSLIV